MKIGLYRASAGALLCYLAAAGRICAADPTGAAEFHRQIQPILKNYCYDCHGDGASKGKVVFDQFKSDQAALDDVDLWLKALKNLRAGLMPPAKKPRPTAQEQEQIAHWIKTSVFRIDPKNPDPGRVTLRRLNRVEYRNTIRDLLGIDFNTRDTFPPDDTGYGFDTIADVLTLPPILLEKYLNAAEEISAQATGTATGPNAKDHSAPSPAYTKLFPNPIPSVSSARRAYAAKGLGEFARRAFRRPVDDKTVNRLAALAESTYTQPGKTFADGIAEAMTAVLASPRFLFREEAAESDRSGGKYPLIDEYSLASRLSYFLWSSMPDAELLRLAGEGQLRKNLSAQVDRMLGDKKSESFTRNFTGQWLRGRDIEGIAVEPRSILARDEKYDSERVKLRQRFNELEDKGDGLTKEEGAEFDSIVAQFKARYKRPLRVNFDGELRHAMRKETEEVFDYVLHEDRSVLELLDSDYTFLNERLATLYGITNVTGSEMRRVTLPADSPRGGVLTEGTVLVTTSNPTRTSPVKRGLFILDSVLGTPPPPPPPNIPPLEDAAKGITGHKPTLRETLALHRKDPLCASCHNRMDPLGLAFENFNAMGMWRKAEHGDPIDATGTLITGESFSDVKELKRILVAKHAKDFYRTLTEKMLIYALGRGLEYYDVETVDQIVARLEAASGRPSALLAGVVESAPFQKCRRTSASVALQSNKSVAANVIPP